jgi:hypothetical protein
MMEVRGGSRGYVASLVAVKPVGPTSLLHILTRGPIKLEGYHQLNFWAAESDEDLHDKIMEILMKECPVEQGWIGHGFRFARVDNVSAIGRDADGVTELEI